MKIIRLKTQNIQSLVGANTIEFGTGALKQAGLFLISGPTGAGKSTVLDAISLALYGRTPRCPEVTEKTVTENNLILSTGCSAAYAELVYMCGQEYYRSRWEISRKKNQQFIIEMTLSKLNSHSADADGQMMSIKPKDTPAKNEVIIGLNFDQFTKAVVLAQGDFAAFLKASPDERTLILEKITGDQVFRQIGKYVFERQKTENALLKEFNIQKDGLQLPTDDEFETSNTILQSSKAHTEQLSDKISSGQILHEQLKNANIANQSYQTKTLEYQQCLSQQTEFEPYLELMIKHHKAECLTQNLEKLEAANLNKQETQNKIEQCQNKIEDTKQLLSRATQDKVQAQLAVEQLNLEKQKIEDAANQTGLLDNKIENAKNNHAQASQELSNLAAHINLQNKQIGLSETKIISLNNRLNELKIQIESQPPQSEFEVSIYQIGNNFKEKTSAKQQFKSVSEQLSQTNAQVHEQCNKKGRNIDEMIADALVQQNSCGSQIEKIRAEINIEKLDIDNHKQKLKLNDEEFRIIQNLEKYAIDWQQVQKDNDKYQNIIKQQQFNVEDWSNKENSIQSQIDILEQLLLELSARHRRQILESKYEQDRENLTPEQPCPLCGSLDHPYNGQANANARGLIAQTEQEEKAAKAKKQSLDKQIGQIRVDAGNAQTLLNEAKAQLKICSDRQINIETEFALAKNACPQQQIRDLQANDCSSITAAKQQCEQAKTQLNRTLESYETYENLLKTQDLTSQIGRQLETIKNADYQTSEILAKLNLSAYIIKDEEQRQNIENQIRDLQKKYAGLQTEKDGCDKNIVQERASINVAKEYLAESEKNRQSNAEKEQILKQELDNLQQNRIIIWPYPQTTQQKTIECQKQASQGQQKLSELDTQIALNNQTIDSESKQAYTLANEKTNTIAMVQNLVEQLKQKAIEQGFESVEQGQKSILPDKQLIEWQAKSEQIKQKTALATSLLEQAQNNLDACYVALGNRANVKDKNNLVLQMQEIESQNSVYETERADAHMQIGELKGKIERWQLNREQAKDLKIKIEKQIITTGNWTKLKDLIGDSEGKIFSQIAQEITLKYLCENACVRLKSLNPRYTLSTKPDKKGLTLVITDHDMGDVQRSISSLSGGETFLVSLSLSLALSELASNKAHIGNLFIDEGFGTLDAQTLDVVIEALETLRENQNCQIGIISHVDSIKERIKTQILVEPQGNGLSKVEVARLG